MKRAIEVTARVRHEDDHSYTVLVTGPAGEAEVGHTRLTEETWSLAKAGAARLFDVPESSLVSVELAVPRPPYGQDGQLVRITQADGPEHGAIGKAHWFGAEGAWWVTCAESGTGIYPSEVLDFRPVIAEQERAALDAHLARIP